MALKPSLQDRENARGGSPLDQEVLRLRSMLSAIEVDMRRAVARLDRQIARAGGLGRINSALGPDSSDFASAYQALVDACEAINPSGDTLPALNRNRGLEIAANKRGGIP